MKRFTTAAAFVAVATLSASLLAPTAQAAQAQEASSPSSSSSFSSSGVTANKENGNNIPEGWGKLPEQPPLGSAYTGSAPLSIFLGIIGTVTAATLIYNLPPVRQAIDDITKNLSQLPQLPNQK